jgi:hypothetical protein
VRRISGVRQRVNEAARLGVTDVVLPRRDLDAVRDSPVRLHPVDDLGGALRVVPWVRPDLVLPRTRTGPRALAPVPDL